MALEPGAVAAVVQEVADRAALPAWIGDRSLAVPEEALDVGEQAQESGAHQVPALPEQARGAAAAELEPAVTTAHGEGHVRLPRRDTELGEQSHEAGVVALVVDDEPRVDGQVTVHGIVDAVGVHVTARPRVGLVQHDVMLAIEGPGRSQT